MMEQQPEKRNDRSFPERKGLKRKLEEEDEFEISAVAAGGVDALLSVVAAQVSVLSSTFSWKEADRAAAKRATKILAHLAKNGENDHRYYSFPAVSYFLFMHELVTEPLGVH